MLFIFDWDGTLLDSTAKIVACLRRASVSVDLEELSDEQYRHIIGLGLPEAVLTLYPDISASLSQRFRDNYSELFILADQLPCSFYPDVEITLAALRQRGHQLAVATGKSRRGLHRVLERLGMGDYFDASRCADETRSKPHPLMLEQLLAQLDVPASDAVMVGDTHYDLAMAHNAGMECIAVSYGAHSRSLLEQYKPLLCLDHFDHLLGWSGAT